MENYKIRVENEAESREAQELFFELGFEWYNPVKSKKEINNHLTIYADHLMTLTRDATRKFGGERAYKEITLPQLRDLVVLKRNSIDDATHELQSKRKVYVSSNDICYLFSDDKWEMFTSGSSNVAIKPIEKTMKEYLNKTTGEYKKTDAIIKGTDWIEIDHNVLAVTALNKNDVFFYGDGHNPMPPVGRVIWHRHTQPEELPFIDDEPKDNVNHPNHYASSSIECIDAMQAMLTPEQFIGYLRGNIFKYQWRYENKNGAEDLEKSQWYLNKLLSLY